MKSVTFAPWQRIPENSPVDLTVKVDNSGQLTMEIYFPSVDFTISKSIDTNKKQSVAEAEKLIPQMIQDAQHDINRLAESGIQPTVEQLQPIAVQLIELMPREDAENAGGFLH